MTTDPKCAICRKADLRRLIELGWNAKMSAVDMAAVFGNIPSSVAILKHLHEHVDEGAAIRNIPVPNARPMRERVMDIQRLQVEEIERRLTIAQEKAAWARENGHPEADQSDWFDLLDKDTQQAISTILKAQGLTDKREVSTASLKVDVFRLMLGGNGGLAPPRLIESGLEAIDVTPED